MTPEFAPFPKIARLSREVICSEKIDGTNAQVCISESGEVLAGSRNRWLTVEEDNFGFAKWVQDNRVELLTLGRGRHYGEWWGSKIGPGYGLKNGERRFSLFNTTRWGDPTVRPACCHVVPVLYQGVFNTVEIDLCLEKLKKWGSVAMEGFFPAEGVIIYHIAAGVGFKKTLLKDQEGKGQ